MTTSNTTTNAPEEGSDHSGISIPPVTGEVRVGDRSHDHGIIAPVRGPTDVPDEARLHGTSYVLMLISTIMAVFLVALNATIIGTVCASEIFYRT